MARVIKLKETRAPIQGHSVYCIGRHNAWGYDLLKVVLKWLNPGEKKVGSKYKNKTAQLKFLDVYFHVYKNETLCQLNSLLCFHVVEYNLQYPRECMMISEKL